MSRLIKYINESKGEFIELSPRDQGKLIEKDCSYYLNLTKNTGPFNRAVKQVGQQDELIKKKTRTDRQPIGMGFEIFDEFNKWLQKNSHIRRDKSISASSSGPALQKFGTLYYFFPIGKFNYTWVKARDINMDDTKTGWRRNEVGIYFFNLDQKDPHFKEMTKLDVKKFPTFFTTNKGIEIAHKNKYEIWFDCKEYYLVNRKNKI